MSSATAPTRVIVRYFDEVWNHGHVDVLDELLTSDYVNHSPSIPNPRPGPADLKPIVQAMRTAVPDLRYEILDMIVDVPDGFRMPVMGAFGLEPAPD